MENIIFKCKCSIDDKICKVYYYESEKAMIGSCDNLFAKASTIKQIYEQFKKGKGCKYAKIPNSNKQNTNKQ